MNDKRQELRSSNFHFNPVVCLSVCLSRIKRRNDKGEISAFAVCSTTNYAYVWKISFYHLRLDNYSDYYIISSYAEFIYFFPVLFTTSLVQTIGLFVRRSYFSFVACVCMCGDCVVPWRIGYGSPGIRIPSLNRINWSLLTRFCAAQWRLLDSSNCDLWRTERVMSKGLYTYNVRSKWKIDFSHQPRRIHTRVGTYTGVYTANWFHPSIYQAVGLSSHETSYCYRCKFIIYFFRNFH